MSVLLLWLRKNFAVVLVLFAGLAATAIVFTFVRHAEKTRLQDRFNELATNRGHAVENSLKAKVEVLHSLAALYASSVHVDGEEFTTFVANALDRHPDIMALEWALKVTDRADFPRQILERDEKGELVPAAARDFYFPILYTAPASNKRVLGLDHLASPQRQAAMTRAIEAADAVATASVELARLPRGERDRDGIQIFMPIYKNKEPRDTTFERRENLHGFAVAVFRISAMLRNALDSTTPSGIDVMLYDDTDGADDLVGQFPPRSAAEQNDPPTASEFDWSDSLDVAGRRWRIVCRPTEHFLARHRYWGGWLALAVGLTLTLLVSGYLYSLTSRHAVITRLVDKRTAELTQANQELHNALKVLKQTQSQLVTAEKLASLGQMVAGIAHEVNNPLAFVSNNVVVLQRDVSELIKLLQLYRQADPDLQARQPALLSRIQEIAAALDLDYTLEHLGPLMERSRGALKRIQEIVSDLRNFARLDESDLKEVDLNEGIVSTLHIIQGKAKKQNVKLDMELAKLPRVMCYPAKINQVVLNLVVNAIDACPSGGRVLVRTHAHGPKVAIEVIDNGSGIPLHIRDRIFDPFFTTKPVGQGTGLGLSISHGIIADHGGQIDVASTVGTGTTFTVWLPVAGRGK